MGLFRRTLIIVAAVFLLSSFKDKETSWLAVGDSITYLNDHLNETGNRVKKGYLTRVAEHFPNLHYINKGYNGWTAANIASNIDSLGLSPADVYSVFLGTNDWWQGRPVGSLNDYKNNKGNATFYGSFRIIIDKLLLLNPQAKILLITPMQRADFVYINDYKNNATGSYKEKDGQSLEAFAQAIKAIGAYTQIPVVDLYHNRSLGLQHLVKFKRLKDPNSGKYIDYKYPLSTTIPFNPIADAYPYPKEAVDATYDGLHPSDKGCEIIAKAIIEKMKHVD
jgi:lysophospholipase L1-like esterase